MKILDKILSKWILKFITKRIGKMNGSWKTTTTGWLQLAIGVLVAVVSLLSGEGIGDLEPITTALIAVGITLPGWAQGLLARDNDKSSKEVGAK